MRFPRLRPTASAAALGALLCLSAACSSGSPSAESPGASTPNTEAPEGSPAVSEDGDYAFGTDREQITVAINGAFRSQNGVARWEDDTLVLALDADPSAPIAGFSQCMVLVELLNDEDESVIEFPDGRVWCAEVLATG